MINIQEILVAKLNSWKLNRFVNQGFYITELYLWDINEMILLKILANTKKYDFTTINRDMLGTKLTSNSFKILFRNYYLTSIKKLYLVEFAIDSLTVKAFSNLLNLKEVIISRINCENTFFPVLFCVLQ